MKSCPAGNPEVAMCVRVNDLSGYVRSVGVARGNKGLPASFVWRVCWHEGNELHQWY